jgi:hypothetical protein
MYRTYRLTADRRQVDWTKPVEVRDRSTKIEQFETIYYEIPGFFPQGPGRIEPRCQDFHPAALGDKGSA